MTMSDGVIKKMNIISIQNKISYSQLQQESDDARIKGISDVLNRRKFNGRVPLAIPTLTTIAQQQQQQQSLSPSSPSSSKHYRSKNNNHHLNQSNQQPNSSSSLQPDWPCDASTQSIHTNISSDSSSMFPLSISTSLSIARLDTPTSHNHHAMSFTNTSRSMLSNENDENGGSGGGGGEGGGGKEKEVEEYNSMNLSPKSRNGKDARKSKKDDESFEYYIPCSILTCANEACFWSQEEERAYCAICWSKTAFHVAMDIKVYEPKQDMNKQRTLEQQQQQDDQYRQITSAAIAISKSNVINFTNDSIGGHGGFGQESASSSSSSGHGSPLSIRDQDHPSLSSFHQIEELIGISPNSSQTYKNFEQQLQQLQQKQQFTEHIRIDGTGQQQNNQVNNNSSSSSAASTCSTGQLDLSNYGGSVSLPYLGTSSSSLDQNQLQHHEKDDVMNETTRRRSRRRSRSNNNNNMGSRCQNNGIKTKDYSHQNNNQEYKNNFDQSMTFSHHNNILDEFCPTQVVPSIDSLFDQSPVGYGLSSLSHHETKGTFFKNVRRGLGLTSSHSHSQSMENNHQTLKGHFLNSDKNYDMEVGNDKGMLFASPSLTSSIHNSSSTSLPQQQMISSMSEISPAPYFAPGSISESRVKYPLPNAQLFVVEHHHNASGRRGNNLDVSAASAASSSQIEQQQQPTSSFLSSTPSNTSLSKSTTTTRPLSPGVMLHEILTTRECTSTSTTTKQRAKHASRSDKLLNKRQTNQNNTKSFVKMDTSIKDSNSIESNSNSNNNNNNNNNNNVLNQYNENNQSINSGEPNSVKNSSVGNSRVSTPHVKVKVLEGDPSNLKTSVNIHFSKSLSIPSTPTTMTSSSSLNGTSSATHQQHQQQMMSPQEELKLNKPHIFIAGNNSDFSVKKNNQHLKNNDHHQDNDEKEEKNKIELGDHREDRLGSGKQEDDGLSTDNNKKNNNDKDGIGSNHPQDHVIDDHDRKEEGEVVGEGDVDGYDLTPLKAPSSFYRANPIMPRMSTDSIELNERDPVLSPDRN
eukprot:CAMPEP_0114365904 /NCGR_PEP_ID=MMETSP0101-20121206/28812_1 /TAXON_ID=38822 ORGANISM="Pteridomonas danica, Strain PT" /NCGR_SAMPLE_ID=MMETSP0101 /ASSEMBLY_ACC=CAM_ASM_000211 /LENGTH=1028 /DNA_ID=CAMNT_0001514571 /DNA_START=195 /DNA_END=3280 /DNA_ORIENTATION=-